MRRLQGQQPATAGSGSGQAAAALGHQRPAPGPPRPQLGQDIPVSLRSFTVDDGAEGCSFLLVVPDVDAVISMYLAAGQSDRDPYWCEPWPSAIAMSEQLLRRPELVRGKRVCELGCGLGLAGLAAAVAGASEVVLLDREPLALQCALLNAAINGLPTAAAPQAAGSGPGDNAASPISGNDGNGDRCASSSSASNSVEAPSIEQLLAHLSAEDAARLREHQQRLAAQAERRASHDGASTLSPSSPSATAASSGATRGGGAAAAAAAAAAPGVVCAELFDWSQPVTLAPHDACLLCDCLYEAFSVQPVAEVSPKLLKPYDSRLLLADPPDRARHNRECFLDMLCEESGEFVLEESGEAGVRLWEAAQGAWRSVPIALMALRRAVGGDTVGLKLRRPE